ncbi:MAG: WbqC family protein [Bacteroidota bacterium]
MNSILLSTAYLPPVSYLISLISSDCIVLERHENFVKQTYRNRFEILTANGKLNLSIPLLKQAEKELISEKRISYAEDWQKQHWRAITSAYKNSPYFEFFEDQFKFFYENQFEFLFDYNTRLLETILHILRIKKELKFTSQYEASPADLKDLRILSHINYEGMMSMKPYYQVFAGNSGFVPNLSCLDALFNVGLETKEL